MDISEEEFERQRQQSAAVKGPLIVGFRGVNVGLDGKIIDKKGNKK